MADNNTLLSPIVMEAFTLGSTNTVISQNCRITALGFYNFHNAAITLTAKDKKNGTILMSEDIDAGQTKWYDWADMTDGFGFYFAGGLVVACSVAGKVNIFPAGYTA